jgi:hypothetical protein
MNPYQQRLNSFKPIMLAQAPVPGQAVGNMDGIPLEALEGTLSPEQLKQEGSQGGMMPPGFGGPITGGPTPTYVTDIPIKAGYRNIYGTNINATYNPTTGAISGGATIPIGAAEKGYKIGVEGSYQPGLMDAQGLTPPAGYSGMLRFSKTNPVDPKVFERPGAEKYSIELGVDGRPRRVPPQMAIPIEVQSPGSNISPFQNLLNRQ